MPEDLTTQRYKVSSKLCMVQNLGVNGTLFGGNMMAWVDEAAAIFAHEHTGERYMVTLKFGEFEFHHPVREGDIIHFFCLNPRIGRTSCSFEIEAITTHGTVVVKTSAVFVCVDQHGRPKPIHK
ncbi:MAG: acyl-CoA thioesterase [Calditrichaeota bacterium]|nr:acyl-CoA thioesterase [Calditrichota bacterium]MCB9366933.1 acyl-CoA thioesterase [Calditrichota bacterium]